MWELREENDWKNDLILFWAAQQRQVPWSAVPISRSNKQAPAQSSVSRQAVRLRSALLQEPAAAVHALVAAQLGGLPGALLHRQRAPGCTTPTGASGGSCTSPATFHLRRLSLSKPGCAAAPHTWRAQASLWHLHGMRAAGLFTSAWLACRVMLWVGGGKVV